MANDLPQLQKTSYRYDVDFIGRSCNGSDNGFDDSVVISSSSKGGVVFNFANEVEIPAGFPIHFDTKNRLHWIANPYTSKPHVVASPELHYNYVLDALSCAISLERDAAKKSALMQIRSLIQGAQQVHPKK